MKVAQIGFFADPAGRRPEDLLVAWPTLVDVAESAALAGVRVSVVQVSAHSRSFARNGVEYHFLPFGHGPKRASAGCGFSGLIRDIAPDVLHVHGLGFPREVVRLSALAPGIPILLQDHANRLPRLWRRPSWRRCAALISAVAFCASEQADPFVQAGLLGGGTMVYEIPESTSRFRPGARDEARARTGLCGNPCLLWVASLSRRKDPLTMLEGVSRAAQALPELQLWCCYGEAPLAKAVARRIEEDERLRGRVHLLGRRPHEQIETLMRAADVFVLGSHSEGSGYALIEALACGLPSVITDIAPFRALTGDGSVAKLWPCGDAQALCEAISAVTAGADEARRTAVRAHFERELSFGALGRKLAGMYGGMVGCAASATRADPERNAT